MNKYNMIVHIIDQIAKESPSRYKTYYPDFNNIDAVNKMRSKAFIHLYMKVKFGIIDFESREKYITDGNNDGGIDGYFIDETNKMIYLLQSKFRITSGNFEEREITVRELLKMDVSRIVKDGETSSEEGIRYNGKILEFIDSIRNIPDIARYDYQVIVIANIKNITHDQLARVTGGYKTEVFNFEKSYGELIFPVISGTYFREKDLYIYLKINDRTTGGRIKYYAETEAAECEVTVIFVPTLEIARAFSKYKNTILRFNPRSYLELSNNVVNREIEKTILDRKTNGFAIFNNGITMISDGTDFSDSTGQRNRAQIKITNPQVINGGQTGYTLSRILENHINDNPDQLFAGKEVLVKIISFVDEENNSLEYSPVKLRLIENISKATNQQTKVTEADRRSNEKIQVDIQREIYNRFGYFYERKRGEFADGIRFNYIKRDQIIDREAFLRVCIACSGLVSQARRSGGDTIFGKDSFYSKLSIDELDQHFWGFTCYEALFKVQKSFNDQPHNKYGVIQYGNALRYGKFALVSVACKDFSEEMPFEEYPEKAMQRIQKYLSAWKSFEEYVRTLPKNEYYFRTEYDAEKKMLTSELDYDNYYKGRYLNSDLTQYFSN